MTLKGVLEGHAYELSLFRFKMTGRDNRNTEDGGPPGRLADGCNGRSIDLLILPPPVKTLYVPGVVFSLQLAIVQTFSFIPLS